MPTRNILLCIMTFKVDIDKVTTLISKLTVFSWYTLICMCTHLTGSGLYNIMECYLDPERNVCAAQCVIMRFHHVRWWEVLFSCGSLRTSGPILFPFTCTGWPDSIIYCQLEGAQPDCWRAPQKRGRHEPSEEGEHSHVVHVPPVLWHRAGLFFTVTILTVEWRKSNQ